MTTVLITGGAGYIGSQVVLDLSEKGCDLIVLDDLSSGFKELVKSGRFVHGSYGDHALLDEIFKTFEVDIVMHFGAFSKVEESMASPLSYWLNNISGSLTLLDSMIEHKVSRFVFSSSAAVYGNPERTPITEDHAMNPINPYGATKAAMEQILYDLDNARDMSFVSLRYFNAAGADPQGRVGDLRKIKTHLIPIALEAAGGLREEVKIFGTDYPTPDGTCIRDYVHVKDLSTAHVMAMDYLMDGGESRSYNLGNNTGHSVREVIECVSEVTGRHVKAVEVGRRAGDPAELVASSEMVKRELGWRPEFFELEKIVESAWNWFQGSR